MSMLKLIHIDMLGDKKCIKDIVVLETIKEGKTVYKN